MTDSVLDREAIRRSRQRLLLADYHAHMLAAKQDVLGQRAALGEAYLKDHVDQDPGDLIARDVAIATSDQAALPLVRATIREARGRIAEGLKHPVFAKGSLEYIAFGDAFGEDSAAVQWAWSPEVLCPVIRYFGMLPVLADIVITRATATELLTETSHMYHADPDDITQMKVFLHLTDVVAEGGPFHALPANLSAVVGESLAYPRGRIMDEDVEKVVGRGRTVASVGPPGTVTFCDTTRCYHFGGRPGRAGGPIRELLIARFILPTSTLFPQFEGDGQADRMMSLLQPKPGDATWNAFIGSTLV